MKLKKKIKTNKKKIILYHPSTVSKIFKNTFIFGCSMVLSGDQ